VLMLDNRGVGRSESLQHKAAYSTTIMALDVLSLLVDPPFVARTSRTFVHNV